MACGHLPTVTCPECDRWRNWNQNPVKWTYANPFTWEIKFIRDDRLKRAMWDALQTLSCDKDDYDPSVPVENFIAAFNDSIQEFSRDFDDLIDQVIVLTAKNRELQKIVDSEKKNAG